MENSLQTIINILCDADDPSRKYLEDITVNELLGALDENHVPTNIDTVA